MRIQDSLKIFNYNMKPSLPSFVSKPDSIISLSPEIKDENVDSFVSSITPQGTVDKRILADAPNPDIIIKGEKKKAGIVVDISKNILYRYDKDGNPINAYLIASGKKSTPTETGTRIVTHREKYPYKSAIGTKRKRNPEDYGPFIIILDKIDIKTGKQSRTGEFIHGCKSYEDTFESTPDRYVSHGCIRMDNDIITALSAEVQKGEIVIIK